MEEYKIGFRPMRSESLPYRGEMLKAVIVESPTLRRMEKAN